jgi:hypothetical protein
MALTSNPARITALGLSVESDFPIRYLPPSTSPTPDVRFRQVAEVPDPASQAAGDFTKWYREDGIRYVAKRVGEFHVSVDGREANYALYPEAKRNDLEYVLTGPVLSMAAQAQGAVLLHAAAINVGGRAVAFAAPRGSGKSTLAGYFHSRGFEVLADDVVPLRTSGGQVLARPSVPWIKLGPDALRALDRDASDLEEIRTGSQKRRLLLGQSAPSPRSELPLSCVYILRPGQSCTSVRITVLDAATATLSILKNMWGVETMFGERMVPALEAAARLAELVPTKEVAYFRSFAGLADVADAVVADASPGQA